MYQKGDTIEQTLKNIQSNSIVLPAIQREFVWKSDQIYRFFDSVMQGYPFGTLLFWRVEPENSDNFNFYDFVIDYHERDNRHCPVLPPMPNTQLTAVLDGQQRLTALNIGLRGSIAWKKPRLHRTNPDAFPRRRLYLDLLWEPNNEDDELKFRFQFLANSDVHDSQPDECWFPVGEILSMANPGPAMTRWLNNYLVQEQVNQAHEPLFKLYEVIRSKELVWFYEEKDQDLDKVLQIFIRMNQGGTELLRSDLLLSIAVAQWTKLDARTEIHTFVDELNKIGYGFTFSKDLVLKAGLMFSDIGSVGFKVENFNRVNMQILEKNWEGIKRALTLTVCLISKFGFNSKNLTANNAILPIAYYLYHCDYSERFLWHREFLEDRQIIFEWVTRSLLKSGIWGSGLDTLLTALRRIIKNSEDNKFPVNSIREEMARRGKFLTFEEEELEEFVDMKYGDRLTFALLSLIFPFVNLNDQFHIDHIYPRACFKQRKLREIGIDEVKIEKFLEDHDKLANLQLLVGAVNSEKSEKLPAKWLSETMPDTIQRKEYQEKHLFGDLTEDIAGFEQFYDVRRERLKERIRGLLGR